LKNKKISYEQCLKKAYSYLSRYSCSEVRLRSYLERKGCQEFLEAIIAELKARGYVDDEVTARMIAESLRRRYGLKMVEKKLLDRGFQRDTVKKILAELSTDLEIQVAVEILEKKLKSIKEKDFKKTREKLLRFLSYRGFSYEVAAKAIKKAMNRSEEG